MKASIFGIMMLYTSLLFSQALVCSEEDKRIFETKMMELQALENKDPGIIIKEVGLSFMGTPYVAKTLEIGDEEALVINFQGLDCTTYVENTLAFSNLLFLGKSDFDSFTNVLENIRYRDGKLNGYASRLHYFSEWISNNQKMGYLKDITKEVGGENFQKNIDFMSTHRDLYPFLEDDKNYEEILSSEKILSEKSFYVLKTAKIHENEKKIKDGDIIALTTSIKGLDVTHTGLAIFKEDGRLHLLHASSSGKVTVTNEPLTDYLKGIKNNTGITVARPLKNSFYK